MSRQARLLTISVLSVFALVAPACGDDDAASTGHTGQATDTGDTGGAETGSDGTGTPSQGVTADTITIGAISTTDNWPGLVFNGVDFANTLGHHSRLVAAGFEGVDQGFTT